MDEAQAAPSRPANGLTTLVDIVTSPRSGFATLAEYPTWGWAYLIATVFMLVGGFLMVDAMAHALTVYLPGVLAKNPRIASMSPEEVQRLVNQQIAFAKWLWVINPIGLLVVNAVWTLLLLLGNAIAKGKATFKTLWAMSLNVSAVTFGLSYLVSGLIVMVRGPADFNSTLDLALGMPSLAWIFHGNAKVAIFFASFSPFGIWFAILTAIGLTVVARLPKITAHVIVWTGYIVVAGLLALIAQ